VLTGIVDSQSQPERAAEPTGTDDPFTHTSYDFTFNVKPDAAYEHLLGTGNFEGQSSETARLHTERETATFPVFAWPDRGDRIALVGSWVWDCDHLTAAGEHTEIHPFRALWVERNPGGTSPRSPQGDREADLFVTTVGTPADLQALCGGQHKGDRPGFKQCVTMSIDQGAVMPVPAQRYVLRAPPRPSRSAKLVYRVVDRGSTSPAFVQRLRGGVAVSTAPNPIIVAKQIFVGWRPVEHRPVHLRVRLRELLVRRSMDPGCAYDPNCPDRDGSTLVGQITKPPGEWNVYLDAGGNWVPWKPLLLLPTDGQRIKSKQTIDLYVARGKPWRFFVQTRECDFGTLGNAYSSQGEVVPCPHTGEVGNTSSDDQPGILAVHFRSPAASIGTHRVNSSLDGSSCPPSNVKGCYRLTFSVARIRP
jgi:hypothetical protein